MKAKRDNSVAWVREVAARATAVKEGMIPIREGDFKRFMADAQAARDRVKKKQEERKKKDAQYADTKKHGVKFYDKKGSGRIVKGKKIYS